MRKLLTFACLLVAATSGAARLPQGSVESVVPRWRFGDAEDEAWKKAHDRQLERIDAWWKAFEEVAKDIAAHFEQGLEFDFVPWMTRHLGPVDERLMWEYGPGLHGGHRLVITPESVLELRPMVATMIERAPEIPGWEFYDRRLPESADGLEALLQARGIQSMEGVRIQLVQTEMNAVDLVFVHEDFGGSEDEDAEYAAFIATEYLIGEAMHTRWIREVRIARVLDDSLPSLTTEELAPTVQQWKTSIEKQLPEHELFRTPEDGFGYTGYKLHPEEAVDYPYQWDLLTSASCTPTVFRASRSGSIFDSRRYSKNEEFFCYLKIERPEDEEANVRDALDRLLQEKLREERLGFVTGFGTGLRYSYLELALVDLDLSVFRVRDLAREAGAPERSWILFHDDAFDAEWVGVHASTPPPPR